MCVPAIIVSMKKLSYYLDIVLTLLAFFLLCSVILGYFTHSTSVIVISSLTLSFAATFFTSRISDKRRAPNKRKRKLNDIMNKFLFSPPDYAYEFVLKAVKTKREPREESGFIIAGKTAFCVCITPAKTDTAYLADRYAAAAKLGLKRLVLLTALGAQPDAVNTARLLSMPTVEIWDFEKVYDFLSRLHCAPTETLKLETSKRKFGEAFKGALKRENARKYLFASIVTLLFARFMPYSALYVGLSSISATLAVLCMLRVTERNRRAS